jgi:DNA helicase-2/ATP-dependent DNA helicase PcrA
MVVRRRYRRPSMSLRPEHIAEAEAAQHRAAHDPSEHVRVVAGPGTGKSATIEERVCWLLDDQGVAPSCVVAVSFTRASTSDIRERIEHARARRGISGDPVAVSTLHALALRILRRAGVLESFPADPTVLGHWELRNIFEAEFGKTMGIRGVTRPEQIRRDHEAFWQSGAFDPPNVVPPDPPISDDERDKFQRFHGPRSQLYSCVLPGEVVARCVERMDAGTLDPAALLGIEHLIVDEFQDLNPMDLRFVHGLADHGVRFFVAGDDDQSLYAFRYASPQGISDFPARRPGSGDHTLSHCFRCAPRVLDAAQTLIRANAADGRIEKNLVSLWEGADPPVLGGLGCWKFASGVAEARAIARSCQRLIGAGVRASELMILVASKTTPASDIEAALGELDVPYSPVKEASIIDTDAGRAGYALLSIVIEPQDYVAHRTLLGIRDGVGLGTCNDIARAVIENNRNYRDLFYSAVPDGLLSTRAARAVARSADVCASLTGWSSEDLLAERLDELSVLVDEIRGADGESDELRAYFEALPAEFNLAETYLFMSAGNDEERRRALRAAGVRLGEEEPDMSLVPERVQVLTMHGAKGLSAQVVFIPGLEEASLPGEKRRAYPGLVLEAARMLFVSITRGRVVCVLSYARTRVVNGANGPRTPSRFTSAVGKPFSERTADGMPDELAGKVAAQVALMATD